VSEVAAPAWQPVAEQRDDVVTPEAAAALHGLLDGVGPPPGMHDPLPPLWHWLAFLPTAPQRDLGPDGHPKQGGFLPPTHLPRRMFAGGRLDLPVPVAVGRRLHRTSQVTSVAEKDGRSGHLVFVEVTHQLASAGRPVIVEVQDLVYREAAAGGTRGGGDPAADDGSWRWEEHLPTDPTVLFRFSALTYNAHRIHYDRAYATDVEGYPGLVVHGPLQAIALAELCRRHLPEHRVSAFSFRALRPAFDGPSLRLRGRLTEDHRAELEAVDADGHPTMTAEAALEP
jgi:3-methylfumaryl-CoA hydratase